MNQIIDENKPTGIEGVDWIRHPNGGGWIHATARVHESAYIPPTTVGEWATVGPRGEISPKAAWEKSPLFVIGPKHPVFQPDHGYIQIGCRSEKFEWWTTPEAEEFGRKNGYTQEEITHYQAIIAFIATNGK